MGPTPKLQLLMISIDPMAHQNLFCLNMLTVTNYWCEICEVKDNMSDFDQIICFKYCVITVDSYLKIIKVLISA